MFGDVAVTLLRHMGMSGDVPGAVLAADVPGALRRLRQGVDPAQAEPGARPPESDAGDEGPRVTLRTRAFPLIQLLEAAAAHKHDVIWEQESKSTG